MYKLIRFYNQNRKKVWIFILIIVFLFAILRLLNYMAKQKNSSKIASENNSIFINNSVKENSSIISNKSVVGGTSISTNKLNEAENVIDKFMNYCNDCKIEEAYNLLSEDCKEQLFETEEVFKNNYYDSIFNDETKLYTIENWTSDTYKINISNDILATGNITEEKMDYFTIVKQRDEYKLNIKNYVGKNDINKEAEHENIKIKVLNRNTYMDYEIYEIQVTNNSENDILLDTKNDTKTIYLQDNKGAKFYAYTNEIIDNEFIVRKSKTKNIKIKFNSGFSSNRRINYMFFSDLILNYNEYEKVEDKEEYTDIFKFSVNIE